ncbi:MAG: ABC transporter ATP-binding protein/permease [Bacilli bacterium]|nr:ABC transporter ATP-binding protein/permease [Bacilli bacterium]
MLKLKNIKKSYKTGDFVQKALDNVSITFRKSEFVSVLGPSGSGKTTLLNVVGGLDNYDSGDLIINGKSTKNFKDRNWDAYRNVCVGFVFQNYNLIGHISVLANVEMSLTLSGVNLKTRRKKAKEALKKVGLLDHANKRPNQLSGGQMQRVAIARALVNDPDIILVDEPTGALDSKTSVQIMDLIKEISKDKLVIMVTHNADLASRYSSRIVELKDGKIVSDSNPINEKDDLSKKFNIKKTAMGFLTALKLSLNNIYTKKGRTFLTAFASSIGIIGIALILSISNGFDKQIDNYESSTLTSFPIGVSPSVSTMSEDDLMDNKKSFTGGYEYPKENVLYPYSSEENSRVHVNNIDEEYVNYVKKLNPDLLSAISYYRITNFNLLSSDGNEVKDASSKVVNLSSLPDDFGNKNSYLKKNYDLLAGSFPTSIYDVVLMVDKKNRIDKSLLDVLFINQDKDKVDFNEVLGKELKLVSNDDYYEKVTGEMFFKKDMDKTLYDNANNKTLRVVGIVRGKKDNKLASIMDAMQESMGNNPTSKIGYSNELINWMVENNKQSEIVNAQKTASGVVAMGNVSFEQAGITREQALSMLGYNDVPLMINIYPKNFDDKDEVKKYLDDYNKGKNEKDKIIYTDYAEEISSLSSSIMDGITIVLVAFSSISLVVSSIMIGIITYISVLERTKEIGILRSLGARKKDITRVFNAETLIIGIISGLIGLLIARLLLYPVNNVLYNLTDLKNIGILNPVHALILMLVSVLLTLIGGFIPAKIASKKDPVDALRTE